MDELFDRLESVRTNAVNERDSGACLRLEGLLAGGGQERLVEAVLDVVEGAATVEEILLRPDAPSLPSFRYELSAFTGYGAGPTSREVR